MRRKRILTTLLCVTAIFVAALVWWNVPTPATNIEASKVAKIEIFDGNTGKEVTITDAKDIEHIMTNLNAISIKKHKLSLGYLGYSFKTTIYKTDGSVYREFIINSNSIIRKDPFFYRDASESIDFDYIKTLMDRAD